MELVVRHYVPTSHLPTELKLNMVCFCLHSYTLNLSQMGWRICKGNSLIYKPGPVVPYTSNVIYVALWLPITALIVFMSRCPLNMHSECTSSVFFTMYRRLNLQRPYSPLSLRTSSRNIWFGNKKNYISKCYFKQNI